MITGCRISVFTIMKVNGFFKHMILESQDYRIPES